MTIFKKERQKMKFKHLKNVRGKIPIKLENVLLPDIPVIIFKFALKKWLAFFTLAKSLFICLFFAITKNCSYFNFFHQNLQW